MSKSLKTPISYYGGKQNMLQHILPLIPNHKVYIEPFFGGGAVFFSKEPSEVEIINDSNALVINFYEVCQTNFEALKQKVEATLFSRATYSVALTMYRMPHLFDKLQLAWAFYIATNMGFACRIGSWGFDKYGKRAKTFINKKIQFDTFIVKRLAKTQVEHNDALRIIELYDSPDAFFYIDPPYIQTEQGHYKGYSREDYLKLLQRLSKLKGTFLLSSYPSDELDLYIKEFRWNSLSFDKSLSAIKGIEGKKRRRKVEMLTANYPIEKH